MLVGLLAGLGGGLGAVEVVEAGGEVGLVDGGKILVGLHMCVGV